MMQGPHAARPEAGFSLIEVLAALAIMAMVSVMAVAMLPARLSPEAQEADRLVLRLEAARREAQTSGGVIGFAPDTDGGGYVFFDWTGEGWRVRRQDRALGPYRFTGDVRLTGDLSLSANPGAEGPDLWFDAAGGEGDAAYRLSGPGGVQRIVIAPGSEIGADDGA